MNSCLNVQEPEVTNASATCSEELAVREELSTLGLSIPTVFKPGGGLDGQGGFYSRQALLLK